MACSQCEKARQRWRVLHVHWQLYRLCGSARGARLWERKHIHTVTRWSWLLSQIRSSGEVQGSALVLLTGTSWRPVNTPTTYSSGKLNCWGSRGAEGGRVRRCNYLSGRPADPQGPERQKRFFMLCFRVNGHQAFAPEPYLWALSLQHSSQWWKGFIPTRLRQQDARMCETVWDWVSRFSKSTTGLLDHNIWICKNVQIIIFMILETWNSWWLFAKIRFGKFK